MKVHELYEKLRQLPMEGEVGMYFPNIMVAQGIQSVDVEDDGSVTLSGEGLVMETATKEFTMLELFPNDSREPWKVQSWCNECGAFVSYEEPRQKHVNWHNKLLP